MKNGKTLTELAATIEAQRTAKMDFVASTGSMGVTVAPEGDTDQRPRLEVEGAGSFPMRDLAVQQIADRTGVPIKYVRRCQTEAPALFANNLNHWLHAEPERRLVRTLSKDARAFLSNKYQRVDNFDVANVALPIFSEFPGLQIRSTEITESRLYIKASLPSLTREIKSRRVGDLVEAGVMISNSEVGLGSVSITPFAFFLVCTNGMTRDGAKRWAHLGKRVGDSEDAAAVYLQDDTKKAMDHAILLQVRDQLKGALSEASFDDWLKKIQVTTTREVTGNPVKAIEVLSQTLGFNEAEQGSIMQHLIRGGDLSQYGLMNAVTRTAEDIVDYDRATEFEALGQRVVDLTQNEWRKVAEAA